MPARWMVRTLIWLLFSLPLVTKSMMTRRPQSTKAPAPGPVITFGHLFVLFIGFCGFLFNVSINFNGSRAIEAMADGAGFARGLELGLNGPFLLTVPFYVYEDRDLNWEDATLNGESYEPAAPSAGGCGTLPRHIFTSPANTLFFVCLSQDGKHSDDYWYMRAAMKHPMRTMDPREAKLFFVPILANAVLQMAAPSQVMNRRGKFCVHADPGAACFDPKANFALFDKVDIALGESEYFQRSNGTDHLVVLSHFYARKVPPQYTNLFRCNTLGFENEIPESAKQFDRLRSPGFYVGNPCPTVADKTHDFAMIATFKHNLTNVWKSQKLAFQSRADVCEWLGPDHSVSKCGPGDQCPALAQARYGFHVRGDTWGSNRLMDTIMSQSVPIFTAPEQYDILPGFYPWKNVSYYVDVSNQESFTKGIEDLLSRPESEYQDKLRLIEENMHLLNHTQGFQFDGHMTELARKLGHQI